MQDPIARMLSELCTARGSLPSHYICVCLMHDSQRHGKCDLQSCMVVVNQVVNGQTCQALQGVGLGWLDWLKLGRRVLYRTALLYGAHML